MSCQRVGWEGKIHHLHVHGHHLHVHGHHLYIRGMERKIRKIVCKVMGGGQIWVPIWIDCGVIVLAMIGYGSVVSRECWWRRSLKILIEAVITNKSSMARLRANLKGGSIGLKIRGRGTTTVASSPMPSVATYNLK